MIHLTNVLLESSTGTRLHIDAKQIDDGSCLLVLGQNGAGKSTLLDILSGLEKPSSGMVSCEDERIGYLYQSPEQSLFALSLVEEFAFSMRQSVSVTRDHWEDIQRDYLTPLHLGADGDALPQRWSTGMKRKLAFALMTATKPSFMLLDEPTSGLDKVSRDGLVSQLKTFLQSGGSIVVATHDLDTFLPLATRVWVLQNGQICFDGTVATLLMHPTILADAGVGLSPALQFQFDMYQRGWLEWKPSFSAEEVAMHMLQHRLGSERTERVKQSSNDEIPLVATWNTPNETSLLANVSASRQGDLDVRSRWLTITCITIAMSISHGWMAWSLDVGSTLFLLFSGRTNWRLAMRWSVAWALFVAATAFVAGIQLHAGAVHPIQFRWLSAWEDVGTLIPYWCFLQMGQLLVTKSTAFELGGMIHQLFSSMRFPERINRIAAITATLVYRFIPAISQMYRHQVRAYQARTLGLPRRSVVHRVSSTLAPFLIRIIEFGETTSDALFVRGLFRRPFATSLISTAQFQVKDFVFVGVGLVLAVAIVLAGA